MKGLGSSPWSVAVFPLLAGALHAVTGAGAFFSWFVTVQVLVAATAFISTFLTRRPYRPYLMPGIVGGALFGSFYYLGSVTPGTVIVSAVAVAIAAWLGHSLAQIPHQA